MVYAISYILWLSGDEIRVSGFIYLREKFLLFLTYVMELYHLMHFFPKLALVMDGLNNVCQEIEVNDVII